MRDSNESPYIVMQDTPVSNNWYQINNLTVLQLVSSF